MKQIRIDQLETKLIKQEYYTNETLLRETLQLKELFPIQLPNNSTQLGYERN